MERRGEAVISPLEGEMAGRPEGVAARRAPTSIRCRKASPVEPTPSVAFGDISPSRGEITPHARNAWPPPRHASHAHALRSGRYRQNR
ncbi:MAG: hypothetical protein EOS11_24835 [Mesorhizobium sp.]|nr:MAG: hypothetical protein EOS11_24835 [Mesorhizobium sp.]TIN76050.1 MAG: hypothetical protein E5Y09_25275 [Mesorhizobium sp.]